MDNDRRAILQLVAAGRITPGEAERLLVVWNERQETLWILGASLAVVCFVQIDRLVSIAFTIAHTLLPAHFASVQHAVEPTTRLLGGAL